MNDKIIKKYFEKGAARWLNEAYAKSDYTYPNGLHRSRIVMNILNQRFGSQSLNLLDIGCGGGDLCFLAAKAGYRTTGIDYSGAMINCAKRRRKFLSNKVRLRLKFIQADFRKIGNKPPREDYDVVTAMGVIYYLPEDDALFACARDSLKEGGLLMVSCRNRLFNMVSGSEYLIKEIKEDSAPELIAEIEKLYQPIPQDNVILFVEKLKQTVNKMRIKTTRSDKNVAKDTIGMKSGYPFDIEGRQHTPGQLRANAAKFGFSNVGYYGVHPHLLIPEMNRMFPPQIFNQLSDCLCAFENLPISLIWSSQFIGVFEKRKDIKK